MNLVLDHAEEVPMKDKPRKKLGSFLILHIFLLVF